MRNRISQTARNESNVIRLCEMRILYLWEKTVEGEGIVRNGRFLDDQAGDEGNPLGVAGNAGESGGQTSGASGT